MPASASAPAITRSSICIEADCLCIDESAAASATGLVAGCGAVAGVAGGSAAARRGLFEELITPDDSGHRDATCDDGEVVSGAIVPRLLWILGAGKPPLVRGS